MRLPRAPATRFAALGLALFVAKALLLPDQSGRRPLVISAGRVAQLQAEFTRSTGRPPSPDDERVLIEGAVEEEILYREAIALGLDRRDPSIAFRLTEKMRFLNDTRDAADRPIDGELDREARALGLDVNDPIVRRIVVQKMRLLLARQADTEEPREADLRQYYERHRDDYAQAARITLRHVFVGADAADGATARAAAALLERLRRDGVAPAAVRLGAPSPLGTYLRGQSAHDLRKLFGADFAAAAFALEPGRWQGPLRSAYGLHLVWIEAIRPARFAVFASVRSRVLAEFRADRREARLGTELRDLRERYVVSVERPAGARHS